MLGEFWLSDMDSNHDKSLQRALCYRYTIGQTVLETSEPVGGRKVFFRAGSLVGCTALGSSRVL